MRLGAMPLIREDDPVYIAVNLWRAMHLEPARTMKAEMTLALGAACSTINICPRVFCSIADLVHALASRDSLFAGRTIMATLDGMTGGKVAKPATAFKAAALDAWPALSATEKKSLESAHKALHENPALRSIAGNRGGGLFTVQALGTWLEEAGLRPRKKRIAK